MAGPLKKRKAQEQLSPYSQEPANDEFSKEYVEKEDLSQKKVKTRKGRSLERPELKGIFKNVALAASPQATAKSEKGEMIAGLNSSFLKAIQLVLEKQSNKDLRYLFEQYNLFMKDIEENTH